MPDPALSLNLGFDWIREISLFEIFIVLSVTDFHVAAYCCQPVVLCLGLWVPPDNFSLNRSLFLQFFPAASPTAASLACLMFGELFSHFQVHSPYVITKRERTTLDIVTSTGIDHDHFSFNTQHTPRAAMHATGDTGRTISTKKS